MDFARRNKDKIIQLHSLGKSSYEIAEELGTYSGRILRALKFLGVQPRSYAEAQKNALSRGRSRHPTKGTKLENEHKKKIGDSRSRAYQSLSDDEKRALAQISKDKWEALGDAKREEIRQLALQAVREASKNGSKTERHINNGLRDLGYTVEFHKSGLVPGSELEVDLFLPEIKTAIEIDGPSHFLPIWGEDKLRKQQNSDTAKQGILLGNGYRIIRIRQIDKSISMTKMNQLLQCIVDQIAVLSDGQSKDRLIEIEVCDGRSKRI